jgi:quercetin dioxygenase-like cupin family protein
LSQLGDVIEIPSTGERFEFRKRAKETNGELLEIEFHVKEFSPPRHVHTRVEERVEVISGSARVHVGGKDWTAGPGETVIFPAGVGHTFQAVGEEMLHFRCEIIPGEMESCFETIFGLYRDGKSNKHGQPNLLQSVILAKEYGIYLPGPPSALQQPAVTVLAAIGRLLGYRPKYERYSGPAL